MVGILAGDFGLAFADLIDEEAAACHGVTGVGWPERVTCIFACAIERYWLF